MRWCVDGEELARSGTRSREAWIEETPWSREIHQTGPRAPFAGATYVAVAKTASTSTNGEGKGREDTGLRAKNKISSTISLQKLSSILEQSRVHKETMLRG
ncbi:hypothetical protein KPH14_006544 [Odynerus spinipes]|uniref:Uncharacterized protein n=1 Tax=Odynerus spinipes TaxID=1348599 RepID=A0AAD9VRD3_9HYME|nr:hypothetical protein KPH14_006544 [Odynerus spinipes]